MFAIGSLRRQPRIFYDLLRNRPIPPDLVGELLRRIDRRRQAAGGKMALAEDRITDDAGLDIGFEVDAFRRHCLLNGLDDIALTLVHADKIAAFEAARGMAPVE